MPSPTDSRPTCPTKHETLRSVVGLAVVVLGACPLFADEAISRRPGPNVLLIVSDDPNCMLGCYGDSTAHTPNIDRLAAEGVRFDRAYCTVPLCGPSRNSFLTGLYPNTTGLQANSQIFRQTIPEQRSMPQAFRLAGYFSARIGKLYHYNVPRSVGTIGHDDPASWELSLNPAGVDRTEEEPSIFSLKPGEFGGTLSWYASPSGDRFHTDGMLADDACWVLERCARRSERPFFLAVGFYRPHTPYVAPKKPYFGFHPRDSMRIVEGVEADQADLPPAALGSYKKEQDALTDDLRRDALQAYRASISFMDAQVGRVLGALESNGLADDTVIVFTSDHGYHTGEHGLWQKMSLFEESARVPLIITAPGRATPGGIASSPVSQVDIFPTLADLCEVEAPDNVQGQSLAPILLEPSIGGRGWALTQVVRGAGLNRIANAADTGSKGRRFFGYSLRTARWRYTEWDEGRDGRELYDHDHDPTEHDNLAGRPEQAAVVAELQQLLREAIATTLPPSGSIPEIQPGIWSPELTPPAAPSIRIDGTPGKNSPK
ncbi:MAG: sulfatase [Planctomycetaceae bacterium]